MTPVLMAGACTGSLLGSGPASAAEPLDLPIVLRPWEHEQAQLGYAPWYTRHDPAFDADNRPYIRSRSSDIDGTGYIHTLEGGRWVKRDFLQAVRDHFPTFVQFIRGGGWDGVRLVFDADDHLYTTVRVQLADETYRNALLYSTDHGRSFEVYDLPDGNLLMEHATTSRPIERPPMIGVFERWQDHENRWGSYNRFAIVPIRKTDAGLVVGEPVEVTDQALSFSRHSGGASVFATAGDATFLVWPGVVPFEDEDKFPGAPTYIARYDHGTGGLSEPRLVAYAPPVNDGHNTPGITIGPEGRLHVITGAHGGNFFHTHSLAPLDIEGEWSDAEPTVTQGWRDDDGSQRGRQSYVGLAMDDQGMIHLVSRQWWKLDDPYPDPYFGGLTYQSRQPTGPWNEPTVLVVPPTGSYSVYYHRLSIDRLGRLFVSYSYRNGAGLYNEHLPGRYHFRSLLMSADGGATWQLADTQGFLAGLRGEAAKDAQAAPGTLVGTVRDEQGEPVEQAAVLVGIAEGPSPLAMTNIREVRTDARGRFEVTGIMAAEVEIAARHDRGTARRSVTLPEGSEPLTVDLVLAKDNPAQ